MNGRMKYIHLNWSKSFIMLYFLVLFVEGFFPEWPFLTYVGTFKKNEDVCVRKICRNSKGSEIQSISETSCIGLGTQNWPADLKTLLCFA